MIARLNTARLQFDVIRVPGVIVARTDSHDATAIDSIDDRCDHPFIYGATNARIVPFKNVNLGGIRRFYQAGFREMNGHMLHAVSSKAYMDAEEWMEREKLSPLVNQGLRRRTRRY